MRVVRQQGVLALPMEYDHERDWVVIQLPDGAGEVRVPCEALYEVAGMRPTHREV